MPSAAAEECTMAKRHGATTRRSSSDLTNDNVTRPDLDGGSGVREDGSMTRATRYLPELRERAMRLVREHLGRQAADNS